MSLETRCLLYSSINSLEFGCQLSSPMAWASDVGAGISSSTLFVGLYQCIVRIGFRLTRFVSLHASTRGVLYPETREDCSYRAVRVREAYDCAYCDRCSLPIRRHHMKFPVSTDWLYSLSFRQSKFSETHRPLATRSAVFGNIWHNCRSFVIVPLVGDKDRWTGKPAN
jgi:hypothetical protein